MKEANCIGCGFCEIEPPATRYGSWLTCCTDPDKPLHGARRVVDANPFRPERVTPPSWCRGRIRKEGRTETCGKKAG